MKNDAFIAILNEVIREINSIEYNDENKIDKIKKKLIMLISNKFGENSKYINEIDLATFSYHMPIRIINGKDYSVERKKAWNDGKEEWINTIETIIDELTLFSSLKKSDLSKQNNTNKIFIVHGHDNEMLKASEIFLTKLGLEPIILHKQPNQGRTIIEKFEDFSDVDFAIVLFSPDDLGRSKEQEELKPRPRQNVVFELGFFIGKLSRKNVVVLYRNVPNFEMLSDFQGVLFIPYQENWEFSVLKEMKSVGFDIDGNKLI
jgi:predicted nucleotide-binding protein